MFTPLPAPSNPNRLRRLDLWATYYYIYSATAIRPTAAGIDLLGERNRPLGHRLTERDYCSAAIEGTVIVRGLDGTVETLNFLDAGAPNTLCDCRRFAPSVSPAVGKTRFRTARGRFGDGAGGFALVPFRTIAVDRDEIPLGTALYVPAARGITFDLPNGSSAVHDGYFFAADVGGSIRGNHIDVFQATLRNRPFAPFITSSSRTTFEARIVTDSAVIAALRSAHTYPANTPRGPVTGARSRSTPPADVASESVIWTSEELEVRSARPDGLEILARGSHSPLVRRWQAFLRGHGFDPQGIDGDFGKNTHEATVAFQRRHRLEPTGMVDQQTWGRALMLGFPMVEDNRPSDDRRSDNWPPRPTNLRAIGHEERTRIYGNFTFRHAPAPDSYENIEVTDGWADENIVTIEVPAVAALRRGGRGRVRLHRLVVDDFTRLWAEWESAGLLDRLISWDGMYVPRFKRNTSAENIRARNPRSLSNHSWGTAFDVNSEWNRLSTVPALLGDPGCVRELVAIANAHAFYWGGHFSSPRDGMHFEAGMRV